MAKTKVVEETVADKLKRLYELQVIDSKIDEIAVLKGELPIEVSDLEDEIAGLNKRIDKLKRSLDDVTAEINKHKANIKESETLIERYEKQLESVKNNREYDALTKEIELQRLEIQLSEKRIKEFNEKSEVKKETLGVAQGKLDERDKALEVKKVELEKIIEKTNKEEAKLMRQSTKFHKNIDDRLLKSYLKIRTNYRNGLGVATVQRSACGGCFNKIPPQLQLEISQKKRIIACEHCGRVLVDNSLVEEIA